MIGLNTTTLQDQLLRLLGGAQRGMTVERLRSLLQAGGSQAGKDDVVRALRALSERGLVQIAATRKWHICPHIDVAKSGSSSNTSAAPTDWLAALPCSAFLGEAVELEETLPEGQLVPDRDLIKRLLPYYQEALRSGDGGSPLDVLARHGDGFVFLQPDAPWWPTRTQGRILRMPLSRLPGAFQSVLAKNSGKKLLLGYPLHAITPRNAESQPFFRPVSTFRCRFTVTETHLKIVVPAMLPAIVQDWLRDQRKYGGWDVTRLRSWLFLEDEQGDLREEDDVAPPDFVEIPAFAARLAAAAGRDLRQPLTPGAIAGLVPAIPNTGYYNALVLMPDGGTRYTRSAIVDYDALQARPTDNFTQTALDILFGGPGHVVAPPPILHPFPLAESQLLAACAGLKGPLAVITGPPGTGKSQVISALMLSAAAAGKSVLFAARQHRALDAVQERLHGLTGERVLLVRANEAEGFGSFSFPEALKALQTRAGDPEAVQTFARRYERIAEIDARRWTLLEQWRELRRASETAAELLAGIATSERKLAEAAQPTSGRPSPATVQRGFWAQPIAWLRSLLGGRRRIILFGRAWLQDHAEKELARLRSELAATEARIAELRATLEGASESPVELSERIAAEAAKAVAPLLDRLDAVAPDDRQALADIAGEASLMGSRSLSPEACRLILKHFPLWAVTTLAAGSRIPVEAGLFDYVIFDEAAQTDIASAIPLLYRARAAVIVGDPMQLAMISNLDPREERDLLRRYDMLRVGIGRYAQGRTTLFDLASASAGDARFMLTDHYRCHPEIAAYFNEAFYGRKLAALTEVSRLKVPRGFRAGLHWTDVTGPILARTGGQSGSASSEAEAKAIVEHLQILVAQGFEGTIGVVTFFDYQARMINELAVRLIGAKKLDKHAVKVFTANKFQGDERDVMLLSLCLGPSMPSGARSFIQKERRLLNVAVSRARAVCHVFGNFECAARCGMPHIEMLVRKVHRAQDKPLDAADDRFESPWEKRLYGALVERGFSPIPQHPVGGRFLDLALIDEARSPPRRIDIEVDGVTFHTDADGNRLATDLWRDHQLRGLGWKVLRFWVYELRDDMERCLERIEAGYRA